MTDQTATQATSLRQWLADAIREAACTGDCGKTEEECAQERIQPFAWHHGRLAVVEGSPELFADAVLAAFLGPIPAGFDTAEWTTVRAIQLMNEAGRQRAVAEPRVRALEAEVAAARRFAAEMRDFCSPHGVATDYADRLIEAMDRAKEGRA